MSDYGEHEGCYPPYGCCGHCPYRTAVRACPHTDVHGTPVRGRHCEKCGEYVRGDDNG